MLSARKIELLAGLKVRGLDLRQAEMNFHMARFVMVAGISSLVTYLSYVGVIKIKIPEEMLPPEQTAWQVSTFYVATCMTMALALYNVIVTSFCIVYAQGLALRGPPGSVARCVAIFRSQWRSIKVVLALSMASLVVSGVSISWMKLDKSRFMYPFFPIFVTCTVVGVVLSMFAKVRQLHEELKIPFAALVSGDLMIDEQSGQRFDLVAEDAERIEAARR